MHRFYRLLPHQSTIRYSMKWQMNLPYYNSNTSNECTDSQGWAPMVKKPAVIVTNNSFSCMCILHVAFYFLLCLADIYKRSSYHCEKIPWVSQLILAQHNVWLTTSLQIIMNLDYKDWFLLLLYFCWGWGERSSKELFTTQ